MIFVQPLKSIKQRLRDLEKEISRVVQLVTLPLHELISIYSVLFLERKILLTFLAYDKLIDEISKIAGLLLVMLQMRVVILKQQQ